jgi:bacterioferritin
MKGDPKVIEVLNDVLTAELTAINQYFVHAEMCENWGYKRLQKKIRKHSIGEMKHAEEVIERILFLEGVPNVQRLGKINIGESVVEQFKVDLEICREAEDNATRMLLEEILHEEEEHIDWLEAQRDQIDQVGVQNYLAQQIKEEES